MGYRTTGRQNRRTQRGRKCPEPIRKQRQRREDPELRRKQHQRPIWPPKRVQASPRARHRGPLSGGFASGVASPLRASQSSARLRARLKAGRRTKGREDDPGLRRKHRQRLTWPPTRAQLPPRPDDGGRTRAWRRLEWTGPALRAPRSSAAPRGLKANNRVEAGTRNVPRGTLETGQQDETEQRASEKTNPGLRRNSINSLPDLQKPTQAPLEARRPRADSSGAALRMNKPFPSRASHSSAAPRLRARPNTEQQDRRCNVPRGTRRQDGRTEDSGKPRTQGGSKTGAREPQQ